MALGWYLFSRLSLNAGPWEFILPGFIIEFGLMLAYAPVTGHAFLNISSAENTEGAGLFNFIKTVGLSFGATLVEVLLYRGTQVNWTRYVGFIDPTNPGMQNFLQNSGLKHVTPKAGAVLVKTLESQVYMLTVIQAAEKLMFLSIFALGLILLVESPKKKKKSAEASEMEMAGLG